MQLDQAGLQPDDRILLRVFVDLLGVDDGRLGRNALLGRGGGVQGGACGRAAPLQPLQRQIVGLTVLGQRDVGVDRIHVALEIGDGQRGGVVIHAGVLGSVQPAQLDQARLHGRGQLGARREGRGRGRRLLSGFGRVGRHRRVGGRGGVGRHGRVGGQRLGQLGHALRVFVPRRVRAVHPADCRFARDAVHLNGAVIAVVHAPLEGAHGLAGLFAVFAGRRVDVQPLELHQALLQRGDQLAVGVLVDAGRLDGHGRLRRFRRGGVLGRRRGGILRLCRRGILGGGGRGVVGHVGGRVLRLCRRGRLGRGRGLLAALAGRVVSVQPADGGLAGDAVHADGVVVMVVNLLLEGLHGVLRLVAVVAGGRFNVQPAQLNQARLQRAHERLVGLLVDERRLYGHARLGRGGRGGIGRGRERHSGRRGRVGFLRPVRLIIVGNGRVGGHVVVDGVAARLLLPALRGRDDVAEFVGRAGGGQRRLGGRGPGVERIVRHVRLDGVVAAAAGEYDDDRGNQHHHDDQRHADGDDALFVLLAVVLVLDFLFVLGGFLFLALGFVTFGGFGAFGGGFVALRHGGDGRGGLLAAQHDVQRAVFLKIGHGLRGIVGRFGLLARFLKAGGEFALHAGQRNQVVAALGAHGHAAGQILADAQRALLAQVVDDIDHAGRILTDGAPHQKAAAQYLAGL